jgi:hypothetical protein
VGDRHLNFHETRDNLDQPAGSVSVIPGSTLSVPRE